MGRISALCRFIIPPVIFCLSIQATPIDLPNTSWLAVDSQY